MSKPVHYVNIRLYNNAGMEFPECYAGAKLLDLDKSHLPLSHNIKEVTCKHCIRLYEKRYPWATKRSQSTTT